MRSRRSGSSVPKNRRPARVTLVVAAVSLLSGCGEPDPAGGRADSTPSGFGPEPEPPAVTISHPLPGDPDAGKEIYLEFCAKCHQPDGSGQNGTLAANLVTDKSRLARTNEVLMNSIRNGVIAEDKVMPPQRDILTEQEMKDALAYIRWAFGD